MGFVRGKGRKGETRIVGRGGRISYKSHGAPSPSYQRYGAIGSQGLVRMGGGAAPWSRRRAGCGTRAVCEAGADHGRMDFSGVRAAEGRREESARRRGEDTRPDSSPPRSASLVDQSTQVNAHAVRHTTPIPKTFAMFVTIHAQCRMALRSVRRVAPVGSISRCLPHPIDQPSAPLVLEDPRLPFLRFDQY